MLKPLPLLIFAIIALSIFNFFSFLEGRALSDLLPIKENKATSNPTQEYVLQASTVDVTKYTQSPYNLPPPTESIVPTTAQIELGNTIGSLVNDYQSYLSTKFDSQYIDPFLSVIWTIAIEGIDNPYFWNCLDSSYDINVGCPNGYSSGGWQVGYGIQVSQATPHIVEDFNAVYGDGKADDATFVQQVGQAVIDAAGITNPSTFPSQSLTSLALEAESGDTAARQAIAVLLMDQKLGAVAVAREVASDIASRDNWRATMEGWDNPTAIPPSTYYADSMQRFSNRMAGMAEAYTGVSTGSPTTPSTGTGGTLPPLTFKVRVKPEFQDIYILNKATATAVGGGNTGGTSTGTSPSSTGDYNEVLGWAEQITANLQPGVWGYMNKFQADICNDDGYCASKRGGTSTADLYWCTFLVIDAYNLIGETGLTENPHLEVIRMMPFFQNTPGYFLLPYDPDNPSNPVNKETLQQVKPGMPWFLANDPTVTQNNEHTGLVKTINIDSNGNGEITTLESNSDTTSHTFIISDWQVKNTVAGYKLRGFGGIN